MAERPDLDAKAKEILASLVSWNDEFQATTDADIDTLRCFLSTYENRIAELEAQLAKVMPLYESVIKSLAAFEVSDA